MKMNGMGIRIGATVFALGVSLLTTPTSQAQRAAGISRLGWLEVECNRCKTRASLPLGAIRRPRDTPLWKLEPSLKCRSCRKGRYAPPVHLIKLTATERSRRSSGCIRTDAAPRRPACPRARPRRRQSGSAVRRHSGRGGRGNAGRARFDRRHLPGVPARLRPGSERRETAPIRPSEQSEKPASCVSGILGRERRAFRWI